MKETFCFIESVHGNDAYIKVTARDMQRWKGLKRNIMSPDLILSYHICKNLVGIVGP